MLLPGIQRPELDPRLKHSGVTVLGVASLDPQPNFRRRARRSRRIWLSMILNFVLFVLLCFGILAAWANFSGRKTPDSAALYPGYELTGAQSAPYEYLRITMLQNSRRLSKFFWPKDSGFRSLISGLRTDRCAERTLRIRS